MSRRSHRKNFVERHLDPASRLGEILFGLIMVLGATLTAGLTVAEGEKGVRQLLGAAIGCNIAWGIIDGVMYVMNCMTVRCGKWRLRRAIQKAPKPEDALNVIRQELDPGIATVSGQPEREALYRSILEHVTHGAARKTVLTKEDLYGAVACCWLVILSCFPAAVPFLIFPKNPILALRISNCLLIAMLFVLGHKWGQYANTNRLLAGLAMVTIGLVLVGVAILLGG